MSKDLQAKVKTTSTPDLLTRWILIENAKIVTSYTYDYASTSTQNRRKLHLAEYIDIIKATVKVNETNGEEHEDWEKRLWGMCTPYVMLSIAARR